MESARMTYGACAAPVMAAQIAALQTVARPTVRALDAVMSMACVCATQVPQEKAAP